MNRPSAISTPVTLVAGALVAGTLGSAGLAMGAPPPPPAFTATRLDITDLERVEPIVGDANPLAAPGRNLPANLRIPNDFSGVYRVPVNANTPYAGWYARAHGGVIAVFPQAEYAYKKKQGLVPLIPGGTQYLLGGIPLRTLDASRGEGAGQDLSTGVSLAIDRRVSLAAFPTLAGPMTPRRASREAVLTFDPLEAASRKTERLALDEPYRARRVADLMARAAAAPR